MLPDPTERNVSPLLFQTGVRTVMKLVLTLASHNKNVAVIKPARARFPVRTGLAFPCERRPGTETHDTMGLRIPTLSNQRLITAVPPYPRFPSLVKVQVRSWHIPLSTPWLHHGCESPPQSSTSTAPQFVAEDSEGTLMRSA